MPRRSSARRELTEYIDNLPVIDTHDHADGMSPVVDILQFVVRSYFIVDLISASSVDEVNRCGNVFMPLEERWPLFEKIWNRSKYTGYGLMVRKSLKRIFGKSDITLKRAKKWQKRLPDFADAKVFNGFYKKAGIKARITNVLPADKLLDGSFKPSRGQYFAASISHLHSITDKSGIARAAKMLGQPVKSLDDYLEACRMELDAYKRNGAVALKDQSGYWKTLAFENPSAKDAEAAFRAVSKNSRDAARHKVLGDYVMHFLMRTAREMDLPVQVHTGHMGWIYNDVSKANAALLRPLLDIHRDVRFDLFHANWPYGGEILFLAKNYPNVSINFCWVHIIDPVYSREIMKQAVSSVPHGKIHGFGSDVSNSEPDFAWAHCKIARENIAASLADLIDIRYLNLKDAKNIAADVLFNNPNGFYRLGLKFKSPR